MNIPSAMHEVEIKYYLMLKKIKQSEKRRIKNTKMASGLPEELIPEIVNNANYGKKFQNSTSV